MPQLFPFASVAEFSAFAVVLGRLAGLFASIPMFGGRSVPVRIKIAVIFVMTLLFFPIVRARIPALPQDTLSLALVMLREALVGVTLGLISQALFAAVEFCGQIISNQMGFTIVTQFDPTMGHQTSAMGVFQNLLAMLLFLSLGVHHVFIRAVVESYGVIPVGGWHVSRGLLEFLVLVTTGVFVLGVKLAAPVMVSLLVASVMLGIMARSFPQMNVFMMSFPLNIGIGFLMLGLSLVVFLHTLEIAFGTLAEQLRTLFRLLA